MGSSRDSGTASLIRASRSCFPQRDVADSSRRGRLGWRVGQRYSAPRVPGASGCRRGKPLNGLHCRWPKCRAMTFRVPLDPCSFKHLFSGTARAPWRGPVLGRIQPSSQAKVGGVFWNSQRYAVVGEMFSRLAASRTGRPLTGASRLSGTIRSGRPSLRPCCRARASPAVTRSAIRARSNSAIAPRMCIWSLPAGVVASMPSARLTNAIPSAWRSSNSVIRCFRFLVFEVGSPAVSWVGGLGTLGYRTPNRSARKLRSTGSSSSGSIVCPLS